MKKKKLFAGLQSILISALALAGLTAFGITACDNNPETSGPLILTGSVTIPQTILLNDMVYAYTNALRGTGKISYQWQTSDTADGAFADIEGEEAAENPFIVREGPNVAEGRFLRVTVTRAKREGSVSSNAVKIGPARPRAFMDFSGYTGPSELTSHQPQSANPGAFTLANGITGNGLRVSHESDDAAVNISLHGGQMAAQSNNYLYFFIDSNIIKNAGTVTMEITFFDNSGNLNLQYVRHGETFSRKSFSKGGSNTFITIRIELDNCNFTSDEQQNQGAQFRFENAAIIQRVELIEGGMPDPLYGPPPPFASATALNNMSGKGITGYQAWFKAPGNNWHHWGNRTPGPGNVNIELWPAGWEDYLANGAALHNTNFKMPDGSAARLFNSHDRAIIRTHLKWMRDAGLDGAAPQRFFEETSPVDTGNAPNHLTIIRDAAEEFGRIFYVMYDMSAAGRYNQAEVIRRMQLDWIYSVENKGLVSSPNYAQAEGKPVVCIWGVHAIESADDYRYIKVEATIELIKWFRSRGYYVIGGIPDDLFWREDEGRHERGREMYSLFDMISPWYIGRDVNGQILSGQQRLTRGLNFCSDNPRSWADNQPIAFMPTIWPGFAWTNMGAHGPPNATPRDAGQWIWRQVQEYLNRDSANVLRNFYFAMFDEYDEATNWMKAATDYFDIPLNQYFQTHAADGKWLSSDYYMRMANAAANALKGKIEAGGGNNTPGASGYTGPLNEYGNSRSVIVEHSVGPVFWRNSFERRSGRSKPEGYFVPVNHLQIDAGVPNGGVTGAPQNVTVTGAFTVNRPAVNYGDTSDPYNPPSTTLGMVYTNNAKSGESAFRLAGTRTAGSGASYLYKIADTRIRANSTMSLSFWQRAEDALGANVIVDIQMDNGAYLSNVPGYNLQNDGTPQNGWQKKTVNLPAALNGRYITAVIVAYKDSGTATGPFAALIDDITISSQ